MKILHVAGLHLRQEWFEWVSGRVASAHLDLVAVSGDLLDVTSTVPLPKQQEIVRAWIENLRRTPVVICSGNHDGGLDLASLRESGAIVAVDGETWNHDGLRIGVSGWDTAPVMNCDILVTHAPPCGCACAASGDRDHGDLEHADALRGGEGPELILAGHIHQPQRRHCRFPPIDPFCTVLVPGFCDAPVPNHWVIDTEKKRAMSESGDVVKI
ncbi:hypothetical protein DB347_17860 [Opitutaceae bacterium EW11]|nr:hypothetical protein DB347_17860 [Opitutaceae bacterium EW11]